MPTAARLAATPAAVKLPVLAARTAQVSLLPFITAMLAASAPVADGYGGDAHGGTGQGGTGQGGNAVGGNVYEGNTYGGIGGTGGLANGGSGGSGGNSIVTGMVLNADASSNGSISAIKTGDFSAGGHGGAGGDAIGGNGGQGGEANESTGVLGTVVGGSGIGRAGLRRIERNPGKRQRWRRQQRQRERNGTARLAIGFERFRTGLDHHRSERESRRCAWRWALQVKPTTARASQANPHDGTATPGEIIEGETENGHIGNGGNANGGQGGQGGSAIDDRHHHLQLRRNGEPHAISPATGRWAATAAPAARPPVAMDTSAAMHSVAMAVTPAARSTRRCLPATATYRS